MVAAGGAPVRPPGAAGTGLCVCHWCGLLSAGQHGRCPRCGWDLHPRKPASLQRTWALVIAAAVLYLPAMALPVSSITSLGRTQSDTILSGVVYFVHTGSWHLALVIFVASVMIPVLKLLALTFLLVSVQAGWRWRPRERTRIYRLTELVGRWSMVDVFVVTVLIAAVRAGELARVEAGPGIAAFGAVVVLTMLAAETFDPRLIWDAAGENDG